MQQTGVNFPTICTVIEVALSGYGQYCILTCYFFFCFFFFFYVNMLVLPDSVSNVSMT